MKLLQAVAAVVVAVLLIYGQAIPIWAQESDPERLRRLEQELERMREELDVIRREQVNMPILPKFPVVFGANITIRYDLTDVEDPTDLRLDEDRNGFRTRDRFSAEFRPDGPVNAGLRISTGEDPNPASPFIRMGDLFQSQPFNLDQFYIIVRPIKFFDTRPLDQQPVDLSFQVGKIPQPFWRADIGTWHSEIVWDDDVSPTGAALQFRLQNLVPFFKLEATGGYFIVQEVDDFRFAGLTGDTYLVAGQLKAEVGPAALGFAFYNYEDLNAGLRSPSFDPTTGAFVQPGQSAFLLRDGLQRTNNRITFGPEALGFVDDNFQIINATALVHLPLPFLPDIAPEVFLAGDYVNNLSVDEDDDGFSVTIGLRGGGQEGGFLNPFTLWFTYRNVDNDATLATFADSDLGAGTGYEGFEAGVNYRLHKNLLVQITGYSFDGFPDKDNYWRRVFFDLVANF
jgi:Putative porin